jgi:hypothetical protein
MKQNFYNAETGLAATLETFLGGEIVVEVFDLASPATRTPASVPGVELYPLVKTCAFRASQRDLAVHYARCIVLDRNLETV